MISKNAKRFLSLVLCLNSMVLTPVLAQSPKYLGQSIPENQPEIFGEGFISTDSAGEGTISVTADGLGLYFTRYFKDKKGENVGAKSLYSRFDGTKWIALRNKDRANFYRTPQFVNDSLAIMASKGCIWKSIRQNDSLWSHPIFIDSLDLSWNNGVTDWSVTKTLKLFYVQNGEVKTAQIKWNKVLDEGPITGLKEFKTRHIGVSPGGDYFVCDGFVEGVNNAWVDNYISFKKRNQEWTFPAHLDSTINTRQQANYLPRISPDGEVFFWCRQDSINHGDVYWLSTKELLKNKQVDSNSSF